MDSNVIWVVIWTAITVVILLLVILVNRTVVKSTNKSISALDKLRDDEIRIMSVPKNDIRRVLFDMHKERMLSLIMQDPRHYRANTEPYYLRDVTTYCKCFNINPTYPPNWNGVRVQVNTLSNK